MVLNNISWCERDKVVKLHYSHSAPEISAVFALNDENFDGVVQY
jgi:hypothetical protein